MWGGMMTISGKGFLANRSLKKMKKKRKQCVVRVYDCNGIPLNKCTLEKAESLIKSNKAVRIGKLKIKLQFKGTKWLKNEIKKRDKYCCYICGRLLNDNEITLDHIVPKSKGGKDTFDNLATCCFYCNNLKADMSLEEFKFYIELLKFQWFLINFKIYIKVINSI